jgi:hypothetical protein
MSAANQPSLFDAESPIDDRQAASARMRGMIARLQAAPVPYWRDETSVILDGGAFQRAMRLVPEQEAPALWAGFDREMQRLYAVWAEARPSACWCGARLSFQPRFAAA